MQNEAFKLEQTKLLYDILPFSAVGNVLLFILVIAIQAEWISWNVIIGLSALFVVMAFVSWWLVRRWRRARNNVTQSDAIHWLHRYRILNVCNASLWGFTGLLLFHASDLTHQILIALLLAGLSTAAITALMIDRTSAFSFLILTTSPVVVSLVLNGGEIQLAIVSLSALFFPYVAITSLRTEKTLKENVWLRLEAKEREQILKQQTVELHAAKVRAESADKAKTSFLSSMSHELRTPLNAIIGFAEMMDRELLGALHPKQKEPINHILNSGRHLVALVNEVLDLARIESGQMNLNMTSVSLTPLIEECVALTQPLASSRQIDIRHQCPMDASIKADAARIRQILLNLLSNAVKYNVEAGEVSIACQITHTDLRITVSDTGRGIPTEQQARLFESYQRLGAEQTATEGTGLGLVISKRIVEAMGGSIGFVSQSGVGSQFWVEFPSDTEGVIADGQAT